jgi:hypothetical protein
MWKKTDRATSRASVRRPRGSIGFRGSRDRPPRPAWRQSWPNLPAQSPVQYKGAFRQLCGSPFLPFPLLHGILPQASAGSTEQYSAASQKCLAVIAGSYSLDLFGSIVSSTSPTMVLPSVMVLANCLAPRPSATCSRDGLRCSITAYFSTVVRKRSFNHLTGCLQIPRPLPYCTAIRPMEKMPHGQPVPT